MAVEPGCAVVDGLHINLPLVPNDFVTLQIGH